MSIVIGVTGYAQHGKDTVAAQLCERYGYTRMAFADTLKSMAISLDPIVAKRPYSLDETMRLSEVVEHLGWEDAKKYPEVRRFLQVLGTEGVRDHIGEDSWVTALYSRWQACGQPDLVIPDVRFSNEADDLDFLIGVQRFNADGTPFDNGLGTDHPSERNVAELLARADVLVNNVTGNPQMLEFSVDAAMADLKQMFG